MANTNKRAKIDDSDPRQKLLYLAELAAGANRHDQMFGYMKDLVQFVGPLLPLTDKERQSLCSACALLLKAKRKSYFHVADKLADSAGADQWRVDAAIHLLRVISLEICETCSDITRMLDVYLLPPGYSPTDAASTEFKICYKRLKGDTLKHLSEVKKGMEREEIVMDALRAYKSAKDDEDVLSATHPVRLELNLSLALFYFEIHDLPSIASRIAKEAVDLAMQEIEATELIATEEINLILERLRRCIDLVTN